MLKPMLCQTARMGASFSDDKYVAEAKFDGWRWMTWLKPDGSIQTVGGRNGADHSGKIPYLEDPTRKAFPLDTILDGEIVSPMGHAALAQSIGGNQVHVPSRALPALQYVVFDVIRLNGQDIRGLPLCQRRHLLELAAEKFTGTLRKSILLPPGQALEVAADAGFEGVVYKLKNSVYVPGSRSWNWQKAKFVETLDAKIIGFKPGENGLTGMVGSVIFEVVGTGVRSRCRGFNMDLCRDMTDHPDRWLGRIIEVKHNGLSKDGVPRHPRYVRTREDLEVA